MRMRKKKTFTGLALAAALVLAAPLTASRSDQKTELTVHTPIKAPGVTLPAGEYVLQLLESKADRNVVRFTNADESKTLATVLTLPVRRTEAEGDTKFTFYETPEDTAPALRTWFYPGAVNGHRFVYPEKTARILSESSGEEVPSVSDSDFAKASEMDQQTTPGQSQQDRDEDPVVAVVREVTIYSIDPNDESAKPESSASAKVSDDANAAKSTKKDWTDEKKTETRTSEFSDESEINRNYMSGREVPANRLERQIRKELVTLPFYSVWDHFEFRVDGGTVTLSGRVHRPTLKSGAERVVRNVEGVDEVVNQIEVLPVSTNDDRIRRAVYRQIYGHPALQRYQIRAVPPIHIIVEDGNVTLEGVVANKSDKQIAGVEANTVNGVFSVENNLRVES